MKRESVAKYLSTGLAVLLCILTAVRLAVKGQTDRLLMTAWSLFLALLPLLAERVLSCRLSLPLYFFAQLFLLGPLVGHCWRMYYRTAWWDKLLHFSAGVIFAVIGAYLFGRLVSGTQKPLAAAIFALCFSVAAAGIWELYEFTADQLLGKDLQNDWVITDISSYALGETVGDIGSIGDIQSVTVNGKPLPVDGYLDIGLIDSMLDMLVETAGALLTAVCLWRDRGRHPCVRKAKVSL